MYVAFGVIRAVVSQVPAIWSFVEDRSPMLLVLLAAGAAANEVLGSRRYKSPVLRGVVEVAARLEMLRIQNREVLHWDLLSGSPCGGVSLWCS